MTGNPLAVAEARGAARWLAVHDDTTSTASFLRGGAALRIFVRKAVPASRGGTIIVAGLFSLVFLVGAPSRWCEGLEASYFAWPFVASGCCGSRLRGDGEP